MKIPENLVKKLNERGITVTPICDSQTHSVTEYLFTKKSPSGLEWKKIIGSGARNWTEFVWQTQMWFVSFDIDGEAVKLYEAQTAKEIIDRLTLQESLDEMKKCYDHFVLVLTNIIETYQCSSEDRYKEMVLNVKEQFENVVYDTTTRSQDKEKPLVSAILHRKPFFSDCESVSSLFATYLATKEIVEFLNGEKLTDEQKAFLLAQENPVDVLLEATKGGWDYLMGEFFNVIIPENLNMLMNSQSGECDGENNDEKNKNI